MFPAQTSLIPTQIALARFLESHGFFWSFLHNYPYWYLGTTPYRYLTGPILPGLLVILHKISPVLSLFEIFFGLIGVVWVVGGVGLYFLLRNLGSKPVFSILTSLFYLLGPFLPFFFRFGNGLSIISFSFIPWILYLYLKQKPTLFILAVTGLLLLDAQILGILLLSLTAVFLAVFGWKKAEARIKRTLSWLFWAILLSSFWYTPLFWWQLLIAPSFAGKSLASVISQLGQLLPITLAIVLAVVSEKFISSKGRSASGRKLKDQLPKLIFYWLFIFGFLTLIRFVSDPDFILDWSSYYLEIQLGIAILLGIIISHKKYLGLLCSMFYVLCSMFLFQKYVLGTMQKNVTQSVEYRIGQQLNRIVQPGERVLLSGSTAFWLNAFWDIVQVRGGNDAPSVDKNWRQAAWEVREGTDINKSLVWLKDLKIKYIIVHTDQSQEYFHDFNYPEKFTNQSQLELIYNQKGDQIYRFLNNN